MKRLVIALTLLLAGCTTGGAAYGGDATSDAVVRYHHDDEHGVSCWTQWQSISCLPDSEVRNP